MTQKKILVGRLLAIASGESELPYQKVLQYRERWEANGYEVPPLKTSGKDRPRRGARGASVNRRTPLPGTELKKLVGRWFGEVKPENATCSCKRLAEEMDRNGPDWCLSECDKYIVPKMLQNHVALSEDLKAQKGWRGILAKAAGVLPDAALEFGARQLVHKAVANAKESVARKPKHRREATRGSKRKPYTGWRGLATEEAEWRLGPFESNVRHLTFHVWPNSTQSWQWNVDQLADRIDLFNGRRILGVSTGTCGADQIVEYAKSKGIEFTDVVERPNVSRLRETVTWVPMLERLNPEAAKADEVVFSCHAKGQKYDDPAYTRNWTYLMWKSCLDYWPLVEKKLEHSLMVGSFREFGLLGKWHDWAYSGTFFWWRLEEIGQRKWKNIDQWFAGTESWPGKICDPRETSCLFLNNNTRLYIDDYWSETVWPAWRKWVKENDAHRSL